LQPHRQKADGGSARNRPETLRLSFGALVSRRKSYNLSAQTFVESHPIRKKRD
jgi:hypothetical protein